ncbi:MAG: hypothetical protein KIT27_11440 [Legionellales bacterium]|nr:hypothetical protein [Legionellales bacterium]
MMYLFSQIIGMIGVVIILVSYFLVQTERIKATQLAYPCWNLGGSLLILFSLFFAWNFPSVVIEISWISISLYGIFHILHKQKIVSTEG